jgi:hypothetical protein
VGPFPRVALRLRTNPQVGPVRYDLLNAENRRQLHNSDQLDLLDVGGIERVPLSQAHHEHKPAAAAIPRVQGTHRLTQRYINSRKYIPMFTEFELLDILEDMQP